MGFSYSYNLLLVLHCFFHSVYLSVVQSLDFLWLQLTEMVSGETFVCNLLWVIQLEESVYSECWF
jgi:hypothetical protein